MNMANRKIFNNREKLLQISLRKAELLQSVMKHIEHIESNSVFIEEIEEAYLNLNTEESEMIKEIEKTIECPGCGFKCAQIHTFCMACGVRLPDQYDKGLI